MIEKILLSMGANYSLQNYPVYSRHIALDGIDSTLGITSSLLKIITATSSA